MQLYTATYITLRQLSGKRVVAQFNFDFSDLKCMPQKLLLLQLSSLFTGNVKAAPIVDDSGN